MLIFGFVAAFAVVAHAWGEWTAIGLTLAVIGVIVYFRRLARTRNPREILSSSTRRLSRPPRSDEAVAVTTPVEDPHRIAEEAFGVKSRGRFWRQRDVPRT